MEKGGAPDKLKVTGNLALRGVTINKVGTNVLGNLPSVGFEATATLKRSDFGLGMYVPQVSDEVSIQITCQADEAKAYAKQLDRKRMRRLAMPGPRRRKRRCGCCCATVMAVGQCVLVRHADSCRCDEPSSFCLRCVLLYVIQTRNAKRCLMGGRGGL